ncbi:hypothetical protein FIBSPDRAFT_74731 [Athelia psychrophila]|uniref:Uncharacterized protein n=1 Tax=Athelia psychrophila TaxID=1759441 RepID=A0A166EI45_9AGAM|nr:hypothetical protein FIBSPDRAFT_74731 [Fibularhizoctonia sp. CBS 109695]
MRRRTCCASSGVDIEARFPVDWVERRPEDLLGLCPFPLLSAVCGSPRSRCSPSARRLWESHARSDSRPCGIGRATFRARRRAYRAYRGSPGSLPLLLPPILKLVPIHPNLHPHPNPSPAPLGSSYRVAIAEYQRRSLSHGPAGGTPGAGEVHKVGPILLSDGRVRRGRLGPSARGHDWAVRLNPGWMKARTETGRHPRPPNCAYPSPLILVTLRPSSST